MKIILIIPLSKVTLIIFLLPFSFSSFLLLLTALLLLLLCMFFFKRICLCGEQDVKTNLSNRNRFSFVALRVTVEPVEL